MAIYLDSAIAAEAEIARRMGWVKGITTNPTLLAKNEQAPEEILTQLASLTSGPVFYQVMASDYDGMMAEGQQAYDLIGNQTILKIPATPVGFEVVASLAWEITCSVTAIYSPTQAAVAHEAGAKIAIAYVNRATRLLGDGIALVRDMAAILKGTDTEILAASIKSPEEAALSLQAGANHLTLPLPMLQAISTHELSEKTVEEFNQNGIGLKRLNNDDDNDWETLTWLTSIQLNKQEIACIGILLVGAIGLWGLMGKMGDMTIEEIGEDAIVNAKLKTKFIQYFDWYFVQKKIQQELTFVNGFVMMMFLGILAAIPLLILFIHKSK